MSTLTARGLAEARHWLVADLDAAQSLITPHPDMGTLEVGAFYAAVNRDGLHGADLFAVAPDACEEAATAAVGLPDTYRPPLVDIPVPAGLLVWEEPRTHVPDVLDGNRRLPVVAASWDVGTGSTGKVGVRFVMYTDAESGKAFPSWRSPLAPVRLGSFRLGDGRPADPWPIEDPDVDRAVRVMLATWLLMHQGVATDADPVAPERTRLARTLAKRGRPLADVRVVDLHRPPSAPGGAPTGRTVSVRSKVRGHWKQAAYGPGRAYRRPVWVRRHERGPKGAPWSAATIVSRVRATTADEDAPAPPADDT